MAQLTWRKSEQNGSYYADCGGFTITKSSGRFILWRQKDPPLPAERLCRGSLADCKAHAQTLEEEMLAADDLRQRTPDSGLNVSELEDQPEEVDKNRLRAETMPSAESRTVGRFGEETDPGRPDSTPEEPMKVGSSVCGDSDLYAWSDGSLSWKPKQILGVGAGYLLGGLDKGDARKVRKLLRSKGLARHAAARRVR